MPVTRRAGRGRAWQREVHVHHACNGAIQLWLGTRLGLFTTPTTMRFWMHSAMLTQLKGKPWLRSG